MFENLTPALWDLFATSVWETVLMVGVAGAAGALIGIPLGVLLRLTDSGSVLPRPFFHRVVGGVVNAVRSTPFIILLVAIIPFTRFITGSSIGTWAAVVPLTISGGWAMAADWRLSIWYPQASTSQGAMSQGMLSMMNFTPRSKKLEVFTDRKPPMISLP